MALSFNKQQPLAPKLVNEPLPLVGDSGADAQSEQPIHPEWKTADPSPQLASGQDWQKAELHLANVKANIMKYLGQAEHNPGILLREMNYYTLEKEFKKGNLNQGLYNAIMALDMDAVPHVNNLKSLPDLKEWGV